MSRESRPQFNPATLFISGVTTVYEEFHEAAHLEQCTRRTLAWRARETFAHHHWLRWTGLGLLVALATEWEALLIARRDLKACGLWDDAVKSEAANAFGTYVDRALTKFF